MWDQQLKLRERAAVSRIIPTYVGSTRRTRARRTTGSNHSHVCGINVHNEFISMLIFESFPRMWDQQEHPAQHSTQPRIIPTYVGSTPRLLLSSTCRTNHSHVCGINMHMDEAEVKNIESFPRMWDQQLHAECRLALRRIIPTYVGSTFAKNAFRDLASNHSHVCGINGVYVTAYARRNRIIPTYVGSTGGFSGGVVTSVESFPRMWDQLPSARIVLTPFRIIPTYVGSTQYDIPFTKVVSNHSHVCGINGCRTSMMQCWCESFPRMWDQRFFTGKGIEFRRIIPTYVGSTNRNAY